MNQFLPKSSTLHFDPDQFASGRHAEIHRFFYRSTRLFPFGKAANIVDLAKSHIDEQLARKGGTATAGTMQHYRTIPKQGSIVEGVLGSARNSNMPRGM